MRTADCACRESFGSFCSFGSAAASYDAAAPPDAAVYITPFSCMIPDRCICPISGHSPAASPSCPARHSPARIRLIQPRCCVFSFFILMPPLSPVPSSYPIRKILHIFLHLHTPSVMIPSVHLETQLSQTK